LLLRARRIVVADPARALMLVAEHGARFPRGMFEEEREALSIEALARSGRRGEASLRYGSFGQRYPRSAYSKRLSALTKPSASSADPGDGG